MIFSHFENDFGPAVWKKYGHERCRKHPAVWKKYGHMIDWDFGDEKELSECLSGVDGASVWT